MEAYFARSWDDVWLYFITVSSSAVSDFSHQMQWLQLFTNVVNIFRFVKEWLAACTHVTQLCVCIHLVVPVHFLNLIYCLYIVFTRSWYSLYILEHVSGTMLVPSSANLLSSSSNKISGQGKIKYKWYTRCLFWLRCTPALGAVNIIVNCFMLGSWSLCFVNIWAGGSGLIRQSWCCFVYSSLCDGG